MRGCRYHQVWRAARTCPTGHNGDGRECGRLLGGWCSGWSGRLPAAWAIGSGLALESGVVRSWRLVNPPLAGVRREGGGGISEDQVYGEMVNAANAGDILGSGCGVSRSASASRHRALTAPPAIDVNPLPRRLARLSVRPDPE